MDKRKRDRRRYAKIKPLTKEELELLARMGQAELKGSKFNTSIVANTDIFASDISPSNYPTVFRIYGTFSASGVLTVRRTSGATTVSENLNAGANLIAGSAYVFDIPVLEGESINLQYSVDATVYVLTVLELIGTMAGYSLQGGPISKQFPESPTASGNFKTALVETTIKQPVDVQDHWVESVVISASSAKTANGDSGDIDVGRFIAGEICVDVTAVSGTGPTLDLYLEGKDQLSGKYKEIWHPDTITGVSTVWYSLANFGFKYIRLRWVLGGSSPSFTFSAGLEGKS